MKIKAAALDLYLLIRVFRLTHYLHKQVGIRPKHLIVACSVVCVLASLWRVFPTNAIMVSFLVIRLPFILALRRVKEMLNQYWNEAYAPWRIAFLAFLAVLSPALILEMDSIPPLLLLESYLMDCPEDPSIGQSKLGQWFGKVKDKLSSAMDNAAPQPA